MTHATHQHGRGYVKALILAACAVYLARLLVTGDLANYINIHYANYTKGAVVMFALLAVASLRRSKDSCCAHRLSLTTTCIFLIPLLLGFGIASRPLTAEDIDDEDPQATLLFQVGTTSMETATTLDDFAWLYSVTNDFMPDKQFSTDDPSQFNILDWMRFYGKAEDKQAMAGQSVDLIGFVKHDPTLPDGMFTVSRFFMRHCIFDTFPIGIYVEWKGSTGLKENDWVRIRGTMIVTAEDKGNVPVILADEVQMEPVPEIPYLYPESGM